MQYILEMVSIEEGSTYITFAKEIGDYYVEGDE